MFSSSVTCTLLFTSLTILCTIRTSTANCYFPNGTDRNEGFPNDTYFPINPGDDFSMCCSHLGDQPRSDGLCRNSDGTVIWRESCTDRTWQSPKCIKLCAGASPGTSTSPERVYLLIELQTQTTPQGWAARWTTTNGSHLARMEATVAGTAQWGLPAAMRVEESL